MISTYSRQSDLYTWIVTNYKNKYTLCKKYVTTIIAKKSNNIFYFPTTKFIQ